MSQLLKVGNFILEIDGTKLSFFDAAGHPVGAPQEVGQAQPIILPDGREMSADELVEIFGTDALAQFQTAAGGDNPQPGTGVEDSGGGRFATFEDQQSIGGLKSVGGLEQTDATTGTPQFAAARGADFVPTLEEFFQPTVPTAEDDALVTAEDQGIAGQVTGHDPNGDALTYVLVTPPAHGTLVFNPDGTFTYTPETDYHGTDSFTYKANDGSNDSNVALVGITVNPVNDLPLAEDGSLTIAEDHSVQSQVQAGDVDGDALTYSLVSGPQHGAIVFNTDGTFTYTPNANYHGPDSFSYKANDGTADGNTASVAINVTPVNDAPIVTATDGSVAIDITQVSGEQNPLGSQKVGDYLSSGGVNGKAVDPAMVNGVDSKNLTMAEAAEVKVGFVSEGAGYRSMVGFYTFDANGKIVPGSLQFLWLDASQNAQNTPGGALTKDFLGNTQPQEISLGQLPADTRFGFFIVSDGASSSTNQQIMAGIPGVAKNSDNQAADLAAINSKVTFQTDANGNGSILVNGQALAGNIYFTHDKSLNTDSNGNDMEHTLSGVTAKNDGKLYIGFEDLAGGGDRDYDDVVINVDIGQYNINKLSQSVIQPSVDFGDIDSSHLAKVVVTTDHFDATDSLNLPSDSRFDVQIVHNGPDVTLTISAKSGAESLDVFENFVNQIYFATSGTVEGSREISYQATDAEGGVSNLATVDIDVSVSTTKSNANLASGAGTDDLLHLNVQAMGKHYDLGTGTDTVQLGKGNMDFGHQEAQYLKNIEVIDAKGAGHNNISLSVDDVLDMTDGDRHLTILGQKGDTVSLTGIGGNHWTVTDHGADFTTYSYNDGVHQAVVEVSNQMAQMVV